MIAWLTRMNPRRVALLFAVGAGFGTVLDRIQTFSGVARHANAVFWGEPWWIPLAAGAATVGMIESHAVLRRALHEATDGTAREVVAASAWLLALCLVSAVARDNPRALTLLFVATFVARALRTPSSRAMWLHAMLTCGVGLVAASALTRGGAITYLHPNVAGGPYWLGGFSLHAALLGRAVDLWRRPSARVASSGLAAKSGLALDS